jgi:hypothetical protein
MAILFISPAVAAPAGKSPSPMVARAKRIIAERLIDPDSLQLRNTRVVTATINGRSQTLICGEFNSKNRLGGYVGFKSFVYEPTALRGVLTLELDFYSEDHSGDFDHDPTAAIQAGANVDRLIAQSKTITNWRRITFLPAPTSRTRKMVSTARAIAPL